ncbi:MAG: hypothetical protein JSV92_03430 [archaeon]|nr:MAG: hypothetical protein JSV92_03430 [archaeon]
MAEKFANEMEIGERCYLPINSYSIDITKDIINLRLKRKSLVSEQKSHVYCVPIERKDRLTYSVEIRGDEYSINFFGKNHVPLSENVDKKVDNILLKRGEKRPLKKEPGPGENEVLLKSDVGNFIFRIEDNELKQIAKISHKGKIHKGFKDI